MINRSATLALYACLALALALDVVVLVRMSETMDEAAHVDYGRRILRFEPDRAGTFDDSKMPISALNALPRAVAERLDEGSGGGVAASLRDLRWARVPTLLATLVLTVFVFRWARDLYGPAAAVAAAALCTASPTLMAHGTLATTDVYFALAVIGSLYAFRRYLIDPTQGKAVVSAFALAAAQLAKPFAIYLYAVATCGLLVAAIGPWRKQPPPTGILRAVVLYAGLAFCAFIVVLNVGFCFDRSFTAIGRYEFLDETFARLQARPAVAALSVPVPYPWLQGLDRMRDNERSGASFGNIYLRGELRRVLDPTVRGFGAYYVTAAFYKTQIGLQILTVLGLWHILRRRAWRDVVRGEALLLTAGALLVAWLSFFNRAQIGIRQVLPCVPIGIVIASAAFADFSRRSRAHRMWLCALAVWVAASTASYFPNMIPYMNEWVPDRRMAYTVLADSNLDWGQNAAAVEAFLQQNPDVILEPEAPTSGRILVSANSLVGVAPRSQPDRMQWLREGHSPVAHVGYAHLLFVVPPDRVRAESPP